VRCTYCSRCFREVEVDDVREVRDVDAARRDVRQPRGIAAALARGVDDLLAVVLRQVAVEPVGVEARDLQLRRELLGGRLGVAEDDRALGVIDLEDADEVAGLAEAGLTR
jgi:hypothetical protein